MTEHQYKVAKFCLDLGCKPRNLAKAFNEDFKKILAVQSSNNYEQYKQTASKRSPEDLFKQMFNKDPFGL